MKINFFGCFLVVLCMSASALAGGNAEKGKKIYETRCLKCHGPGGAGDGPSADLLATKPASFAEGKMFTDKEGVDMTPDERIAKVIKLGGEVAKKSKLMQGFPEMTDPEVQDVIAYIKKFAAKAKPSK